MYLATDILGATITKKLTDTARGTVLQIGSDRLTRAELAAVGCYNFMAAARLSALLHEHLQVKNLREVFDKVPPEALALPRLGTISLAVLGAAFEAKGLGGEKPLEAYVARHSEDGAGFVTFDTMKKHAHERDHDRPRKRSRRPRR